MGIESFASEELTEQLLQLLTPPGKQERSFLHLEKGFQGG